MGKLLLRSLIIPLFFIITIQAQVNYFDLEVDPGIAQLNITSLIVNENLDGVPRIFRVTIRPEGIPVTIEGSVFWTPVNGTKKMIYTFKTRPFESYTFTNQDMADGKIKIASDREGSSEIMEDLRKLGKLTGEIEFNLKLIDLQSQRIFTDSETLSFLNPTQSLSIRSPFPGSEEDVGNVIAEWDRVPGASSYRITLIQKKYKDQSLEDALTSGKPLIQDKDVGNKTKVNLRRLLDRQWTPGMDLVFQVKAVTASAAGEIELKSEPTYFTINDPTDQTKGLGDVSKLLDLLLQGDIKFDQLKRVTVNGRPLDPQQLMILIQKLKSNPDLIVSKRFYR